MFSLRPSHAAESVGPGKCRFPQRHLGQQRAWVLRPRSLIRQHLTEGVTWGAPGSNVVESSEGHSAGHGSETLSGWVVGLCVHGTWWVPATAECPWCPMWLGHCPPAAGPHRRSAAGTPRCSPAAPAHTAALASSLSETWAPGLRTPGGWGCWANLQPSGNLETGGHSQPGSRVPGRSPGSAPDPPQLLRLHGLLTRWLTHPAAACAGHLAPPACPQGGCGPCLCQAP